MSSDACHIIPVGREPLPVRALEQANVTSLVGKVNKNNYSHRFAMLNEFIDSCMADLSRLEALVWLVLYRDARGNIAEVSALYIARRIGVERRSVTRALKALRDKRFITITKKGGLNKGSNIYRIYPHGVQSSHY